MSPFKKKPASDKAAAGGGDSSMFDISIEKLNELMELRGKELMEKLDSSDYNGVQGILEKLKVDGNKGLDSNNEEDLEQRRAAYGKNEIPPKPMKSFLKLCWEALHDMLLVILLVCAVVSIGLSFYQTPSESGSDETNLEWIEGVAILVAVLVVVFVTAFNDWRKERQFRGLQNKIEKDQQASVVRDSKIQQIPIAELVVGDLCFIKYGDLLPADGLVVQSSDLKIDESSITGETDLVAKKEDDDVGLLSGTNVMEGSGRMVVVGVGLNSQVGRIMSLLGATSESSNKKKKGKKNDKKDGKKKGKKSKHLSSTKVSPDTAKSDENDQDNTQTVHNENETKQPTTKSSRIRKLPPLKQSNDNDEQGMQLVEKENNNNEQKKTTTKSQSSAEEPKKKSTSSEENSNDKQKKKSNLSESSDNEEEKNKKATKTETIETKEKKKSSSSEGSDNEEEKKSNKSEKKKEEQKKKSTKIETIETKEKKKSSSSEGSDNEEEKKSNKSEKKKEEQKKKSTKIETIETKEKKKSSSSEGSDNEEEKKSNKSEKKKEEQKKKSTKIETIETKEKKKSSSSESSDDEEAKKSSESQDDNEKQEKKSSKKQNNNEQEKKKSLKGQTSKDKQTKKSSPNENSDDEQEKKSDKSGNNDEDQKKKSTKSTEQQKKKPIKSQTSDDKQKKKSSISEHSDDEQEKKSEASKQKQNNNRPTTTSSVEPKVSDSDKKDSKKKKEDGQDNKEDPEKKPPGLAALAEEAEGGGDEGGGSNDGKHKSVLQGKLTKLALYIGYIGMAAAVLTLICLIIRFCITTYVVKKQKADGGDVSYFISFLIQAITVVVVSVPEGLPLAVTLALAYAVRKMMTDNNLVRHLDACETMGNASTICSDKTGTLTTNRMTVVQAYITGKHHEQLPKGEEINKDLLPLLFESISVNSNYTSKIEDAKEDEGGLPKQIGNKTECALLDLVKKWGGSYDDIRKEIPEKKLVKVYTFNSARKMMSTVIQRDDGYRVYTKGASEMVLTKCKSIIGENNEPKDMNDDEKKKIKHDFIEKMANDGLRTICIAYKDLGKDKQDWDNEEKIVSDLICIAIVGIEDPVRKEVPEAIEKCQKAGVVVRMVTGDNIMTARSIAIKCGIIKPDDDFLVLEGKEFNKRIRDSSGKISQKQLDEVWPKLRVLARSSPQDKYNLVNGIVESRATQHREVVAVTGDGTNDGPALKRADVGFAMGIQGTDVAKQASDIILTDDNFSSIVKAMMWGRNVYDCIAKFLQFQLTANLSAGVISVVCAAAISSVPLRAVQMLWVNLIMDTLASLALATEPPTEELLNRKPYGRTKSIISPLMMRNILGQSAYQLLIMFIIIYVGPSFLGVDSTVAAIQQDAHAGREPSQQFTLVFNAFVLMTLFNEINSRKLHGERNVFAGIFRNPFFYCIWLFSFGAQILIVTFGDKVFSCVQLDIKQWAWSLLFGIGSLIWQQILLFIPLKPFSQCFSAIYRVCCPCCYKKQKKRDDKEKDKKGKTPDKDGKKGSSENIDDEDDNGDQPPKYATIGQLTNATVVMEPPPAFAKFMLRKSVDRLTAEFQVINAFRSRLEDVKVKKHGDASEHKRNNRDNDIEEE